MSLNSGTYLIANCRHQNLAFVSDSNDGSPVRAKYRQNVNGEKWIVERLGNRMYTFQNAYYQTYAYVDRNAITAARAQYQRQQFILQRAKNAPGYAIRTTDGQSWRLDYPDQDTPITLSKGATTDASNLWLFTEPKSISSGIYLVTNVLFKKIAVSSEQDKFVLASVQKDVDAEKWEVAKGSDGLCSIRNIGKSLFVTTSRSTIGTAVELAHEEDAFEIQETATEGQYTIATSDSQRFWGLSDQRRGAKVTYYDTPDARNHWTFTPYGTPVEDPRPTKLTKPLQVKKIIFSNPLYDNTGPWLPGTLFTYEPLMEDLTDWYHLGPAAASRSGVRRYGIVVKELEEGVLADIKDWELVWNNDKTSDSYNYSLWRGIPPSTDYVVVGSFYVNGWDKPKARDFKDMKAIRKDVLVQVHADRDNWNNKDYLFCGPAAIWDIDERGDACGDSAINTGAFIAVPHYQTSPAIYAINASCVELVD